LLNAFKNKLPLCLLHEFDYILSQCIGQELDQEDIAFFTMGAAYTSEEDKDNRHAVKGISASVLRLNILPILFV